MIDALNILVETIYNLRLLMWLKKIILEGIRL